MKPYYEVDNVALYHGDSNKILPKLKVDSPAVLITDPPYSLEHRYGVLKGRKGRGTRRLEFDFNEKGQSTKKIIPILDKALSMVNSLHIFCGSRQFAPFADIANKHSFIVKQWVWVKKFPPPASPGNWWPNGFELALFGFKPKAHFGDTNNKRSNVYFGDNLRHGQRVSEKTAHPTQKPLPMIQYITESLTKPGFTVLDPFAGSGTTLIAARIINCKAIGIELKEEYCEMTAKRLRQGRLF